MESNFLLFILFNYKRDELNDVFVDSRSTDAFTFEST